MEELGYLNPSAAIKCRGPPWVSIAVARLHHERSVTSWRLRHVGCSHLTAISDRDCSLSICRMSLLMTWWSVTSWRLRHVGRSHLTAISDRDCSLSICRMSLLMTGVSSPYQIWLWDENECRGTSWCHGMSRRWCARRILPIRLSNHLNSWTIVISTINCTQIW
jgi:hypothetical protein